MVVSGLAVGPVTLDGRISVKHPSLVLASQRCPTVSSTSRLGLPSLVLGCFGYSKHSLGSSDGSNHTFVGARHSSQVTAEGVSTEKDFDDTLSSLTLNVQARHLFKGRLLFFWRPTEFTAMLGKDEHVNCMKLLYETALNCSFWLWDFVSRPWCREEMTCRQALCRDETQPVVLASLFPPRLGKILTSCLGYNFGFRWRLFHMSYGRGSLQRPATIRWRSTQWLS